MYVVQQPHVAAAVQPAVRGPTRFYIKLLPGLAALRKRCKRVLERAVVAEQGRRRAAIACCLLTGSQSHLHTDEQASDAA
jgi:hypothetical protein